MDDPFKTQLQAMLNLIPANAWYAAASGALTFVNQRGGDYGGLPADHPLRSGEVTGAAWDSHIPFLHPDDHDKTRKRLVRVSAYRLRRRRRLSGSGPERRVPLVLESRRASSSDGWIDPLLGRNQLRHR
jgi:hypothetical protein